MNTIEHTLESKICQRLKQARKEAGFPTAKEFAERSDLKISTYTLHEAGTRSMSFEVLEHYTDLLEINMSWLLMGIGPKSKAQVRDVPIINWNEITHFPKGIDLESKQWTTSDVDLSPQSFALIIDNDAMEPRYPEGTTILVDGQLKPKNKDFALLLLPDKKIPIFKQMVQVDGELYAKSLNPDYKPLRLTKNTQMLGKVIQAKFNC